ncbi:hypothetical protein SeLEV6574_g08414, partial [Synchytrium endobioticum]
MQVQNVIDYRTRMIGQGLTFNLYIALNPRLHLATKIAQIRSDSVPYPFTEEQLLEEPKASLPQDRLYLTRAYHRLVFEELTTFFETIKHHFGVHEQALAEVALHMHQNLEIKYGEILERILNEDIGWHRRLIAYMHQLMTEHAPRCSLEASTTYPGPRVIEAKARTSGLYFSGSVIKCQSHSPRLTGVFASFTHYLIRLLRMNKVQSTYRSDLLFYIVYMDSSSYMSKSGSLSSCECPNRSARSGVASAVIPTTPRKSIKTGWGLGWLVDASRPYPRPWSDI